jgi:hypothetical protein
LTGVSSLWAGRERATMRPGVGGRVCRLGQAVKCRFGPPGLPAWMLCSAGVGAGLGGGGADRRGELGAGGCAPVVVTPVGAWVVVPAVTRATVAPGSGRPLFDVLYHGRAKLWRQCVGVHACGWAHWPGARWQGGGAGESLGSRRSKKRLDLEQLFGHPAPSFGPHLSPMEPQIYRDQHLHRMIAYTPFLATL